ncbi:GNAT family N-acetyltransferase [Paenibacillus sp. p3-SID867]|uniref:GNAT family N-acetyltransferase n=1 Tax=Paenibacillus sp. p3-SID867 TaxID=2916363 RepID=UPI0021A5EB91|nr:GNAT family N-acetyltransferase [Paenibacillus sp. p3-SID867]MCT1403719.1 GNAT family N-acetyltransferase [Paenibacillus sp. p3-SID867]
MRMRTEIVTKHFKELYKVEKLYKTSFPENERIPLWFLLWRSRKEFVDYIAFYDDEVFIGFAYLISDRNLTFVLYLAISSEVRSKGYGTIILSTIKQKYIGNRIILNIEAIYEVADNSEQRIKRKNFYQKNGFQNADFKIYEYGGLYEVLIHGSNVTLEEYKLLLKQFTGVLFSLFYKPKFISDYGTDRT